MTATTTAVAPEFNSASVAGLPSYSDLYLSSSAIPGLNLRRISTLMNDYVSACPILPSCKLLRFEKTSTK